VSECPDVKNYKLQLNLVLYRICYSCTHMSISGCQRVNPGSVYTDRGQWSLEGSVIGDVVQPSLEVSSLSLS